MRGWSECYASNLTCLPRQSLQTQFDLSNFQILAKRKSAGRGWVDSLRLYVKGGTGGTGLPPVDGVGGNGGNIYVRATESISSLHEVRRNNISQRYSADPGDNST